MTNEEAARILQLMRPTDFKNPSLNLGTNRIRAAIRVAAKALQDQDSPALAKIKRGAGRLFVDQCGQKEYAHTVKELRKRVPGQVRIMYHDVQDGQGGMTTVRIGYVIGERWFYEYAPVLREPD